MLRLRLWVILMALGLGVPAWAGAQVITTQEWTSLPGSPWFYGGSYGNPVIDSTVTPSPSGGAALRFKFPAGTYSTSFSGGVARYVQSQRPKVCKGSWLRYDSNFPWNPIGTKIDYQDQDGLAIDGVHIDNFLFFIPGIQNTATPGTGLFFTTQLNGPPQTQNRYVNRTNPDFRSGWNWFSWCVEITTVASASTGILDVWLNDVQVMHHTDVPFSTTNTRFGDFTHAMEWGGGGGTIATTKYAWNDHTVLSTSRVFMPGGVAPTDTTAPATPSGLLVQ